MKLEIFGEIENKEEKVYLKLTRNIDNSVSLYACNEEGITSIAGLLLSITQDGYILREPGINRGLGFTLDEKGRIMVKNY